MEQDLIHAIDHARKMGATYDIVHSNLRAKGVPDPDAVLQQYMATPLPDGRPRGHTNPGDPAEHGVG